MERTSSKQAADFNSVQVETRDEDELDSIR